MQNEVEYTDATDRALAVVAVGGSCASCSSKAVAVRNGRAVCPAHVGEVPATVLVWNGSPEGDGF